jgi:hypothetical protein
MRVSSDFHEQPPELMERGNSYYSTRERRRDKGEGIKDKGTTKDTKLDGQACREEHDQRIF